MDHVFIVCWKEGGCVVGIMMTWEMEGEGGWREG